MLAYKNRFHGHKSVSRVKGKSIQTELYRAYYANNKLGDFRVAVVTSKKISKLAVDRNKIRRKIFEIIRKSRILEEKSVDIVFIVRSINILKISNIALTKLIEDSLKKTVLHQ